MKHKLSVKFFSLIAILIVVLSVSACAPKSDRSHVVL